MGDLQEQRGFCRSPAEPPCGLAGEPCCARNQQADLPGRVCVDLRTTCMFLATLEDTECVPCGALGQLPCQSTNRCPPPLTNLPLHRSDWYVGVIVPSRRCKLDPEIQNFSICERFRGDHCSVLALA